MGKNANGGLNKSSGCQNSFFPCPLSPNRPSEGSNSRTVLLFQGLNYIDYKEGGKVELSAALSH